MKPTTVFITGVSGFVGGELARALSQKGYRVLGSSSRSVQTDIPGVERVFALDFESPIDSSVFEGVDVLIHVAHVMKRGAKSQNLAGTRRISEAARSKGVRRQLFISSFSALSTAKTEYAETKRELEALFRGPSDVILRPGLVVGAGGLFKRMWQTMRHPKILPLLGGGRQFVPIVWIEDIADAIDHLLQSEKSGEFNLFNGERLRLIDLLAEIRRQGRFRVLFCPISIAFVLSVIRLFERFRIPIPVGSENIEGLIANSQVRAPSHLRTLIGREKPMPEMISELVKKSI